jgi:hypothetical protein
MLSDTDAAACVAIALAVFNVLLTVHHGTA